MPTRKRCKAIPSDTAWRAGRRAEAAATMVRVQALHDVAQPSGVASADEPAGFKRSSYSVQSRTAVSVLSVPVAELAKRGTALLARMRQSASTRKATSAHPRP